MWQLVGDDLLESVVKEFEAGSQEVGFDIADKVLTIHSEVIALARNGKITVFSHPLSKQLTVIRSNKSAIRLLNRLCTLSFICEGFAFLNESIKMRIVTEDALF